MFRSTAATMPKQPLRRPDLDAKTVERALRMQDGNIQLAATQLGVIRKTLLERIAEFNLGKMVIQLRGQLGLH
jgi:transcriptional regulator of acetoin/glycerol metabolism